MTNAVLFSSTPGRYAKALFEIGKEQGILEELLDNLETFSHFLSKNTRIFPYFSYKTAKSFGKIIEHTGYFNKSFTSLLNVLIENQRLNIITNIATILRKAVLRNNGEREVTVSSVTNLSDAQRAEVENAMHNLFKASVNIRYITDTSIMCGLIIESDGVRIDASGLQTVRQLEKYCKSLELT